MTGHVCEYVPLQTADTDSIGQFWSCDGFTAQLGEGHDVRGAYTLR